MFGRAYERIADASCSESTLRRRSDEWIELGVMERLRRICLDAYKRLVCLELSEVAVDGWLTKAPCGGQKAGRALDFWVAFSEVVILVSRLIQEGWVRYRWEGRSSRRP